MVLVFPFFFPLFFVNESANSESGKGDKRIAKKNVLSLTLIPADKTMSTASI
jgi:hypothetical protein